ncbi:hypothetical protein [Nocardia sp. NPDC005745]
MTFELRPAPNPEPPLGGPYDEEKAARSWAAFLAQRHGDAGEEHPDRVTR